MSSPRDDFAISTRAHLLNSIRYQANLDERSEYLRHASVKKFGITTMTDGATIQKHPLLNFMGACVIWPKALFLKCVDCTDHLAAGGSKIKKSASFTGGQNPARSPVKYPHASPNPHGLLGLQLRLQKLGFAAGAS